MRKEMRMGRDVVLALREFKRKKFHDSKAKVTYGYVVEMAYNEIKPRLSEIDWKKVFVSSIPNVTNSKEEVAGVTTTLNIAMPVLDGIEELRLQFKKIFGVGKVYRPFVIKMILFAALLGEQKEDV